jgi:ABC-type uncharacterized transport system substrate-binding protein
MSNTGALVIGIAVFLSSLSASIAWSHPHVSVYSAVQFAFDDEGLAGVRIRWVFDEMFSSMIIFDFDKNGNGRFEPTEIECLENGAFANLREFDYFLHMKIDDRPFGVKTVTDFTAEIRGERLVYQFFVPCRVSAVDVSREVRLAIYDVTFYTSVFLANNPVAYKNDREYVVEHRIGKNTEDAYYYGQIYPEEITLRFKRKNG